MEPDHVFPGLRMLHHRIDHLVKVHAPAVEFYCRTGFLDKCRVDKRTGVDQDIGVLVRAGAL